MLKFVLLFLCVLAVALGAKQRDESIVLKFIGSCTWSQNKKVGCELHAGTENIITQVDIKEGAFTDVERHIGNSATMMVSAGPTGRVNGTIAYGNHQNEPNTMTFTALSMHVFGNPSATTEWSAVEYGTVDGGKGVYSNSTGAYVTQCNALHDRSAYNTECWMTIRVCWPGLLGKCKI